MTGRGWRHLPRRVDRVTPILDTIGWFLLGAGIAGFIIFR